MSDEYKSEPTDKVWPHAPVHRLEMNGVYMITAATLHKKHFFETPEKLTLLENSLLSLAGEYHWRLEAWAVFANHYHFIACSEEGALDLNQMVKRLHSDTARMLNRLDQTEKRTVWYNFWDTKLTYQRSYYGTTQLRSSESGKTWPGQSSESVSLVFRLLVRTHGFTGFDQDDL